MKKYILFFILNLLTNLVYSQNIYNIIRSFNLPSIAKTSIEIQRITMVETANIDQAIKAVTFEVARRRYNSTDFTDLVNQQNTPIILISQNIKQQNCKPEQLYGGYNYLKLCSKSLNGLQWRSINKTKGYNGVHHIINVSTLSELYKITVQNYKDGLIGIYPFEDEFMRNAPGIFHKLHNHPEFTSLFHNKEMQLYIYENYGIKGILDNFFQMIAILNDSKGIEQISPEIIEGTYLETKIWCDYYGLKWE